MCFFNDVKIITVAEGEINELHVGLKGTMNAIFLKDLAKKTKRGMEGRVRIGKSAGGKVYGYDVVKALDANGNPITGEMTVNPFEAAIIKRIFEEFADGCSPRAIAKKLNHENTPGPGGRIWTDTAIRGHRKRGTGIINNERYIGKMIWNRQRFIKDPKTGKRVSRMNNFKEWIITDIQEFRLVSDILWANVKARQEQIEEGARERCPDNFLTGRRRNIYLLSGLIVCGCCGSNFTIIGKDRYGCANRKNRGVCQNNHYLKLGQSEKN